MKCIYKYSKFKLLLSLIDFEQGASAPPTVIGPDMSPLPCLRVRRGLVRAPPTPPAPASELVSCAQSGVSASAPFGPGPGSDSVAVGVGNSGGGIGSPVASLGQVAEIYPRTSAVFSGGLLGRNAFLSNKQFLRRLHRSAAAAAAGTVTSVMDQETPRRSLNCGTG